MRFGVSVLIPWLSHVLRCFPARIVGEDQHNNFSCTHKKGCSDLSNKGLASSGSLLLGQVAVCSLVFVLVSLLGWVKR